MKWIFPLALSAELYDILSTQGYCTKHSRVLASSNHAISFKDKEKMQLSCFVWPFCLLTLLGVFVAQVFPRASFWIHQLVHICIKCTQTDTNRHYVTLLHICNQIRQRGSDLALCTAACTRTGLIRASSIVPKGPTLLAGAQPSKRYAGRVHITTRQNEINKWMLWI